MKLSHFRIKKSTTKLALVIFTAATLVACKKTNPVPKQESIKPTAGFTFTLDLQDPKSISFQNTSKDAVSFSWDFADGKTSTEKDPKHTYAMEGTYKVTLIVSSSTNTKDTITKAIKTEYPIPAVPSFTITSATEANPGDPSVITFQNTSPVEDGVQYRWNFGDGDAPQDNSRNPIKHKYEATKRYTVTLTAVNSYGKTSLKIDSATAFVFKNITIEKVVLASMPQRDKNRALYDLTSTGPDPYFTIDVANNRSVFKSGVIDNSFAGEWAIDFTFGITESIRVNFWDDDSPADPDEISGVNCGDGQSMLNKYPEKNFTFRNSERSDGNDRNGGLLVHLTVRYTP